MDKTWTLETINNLINDKSEESFELEYKGAGGVGKDDKGKLDITKAVSAMANSAGGTVIYGIKCFDKKSGKEHCPDKIDPIRRSDFSKETLQQIISNIQPRIDGTIITPVEVDSEYVLYVVDVPKGKTAHQATDKKYYKRYNSISDAMNDYEIRDVMNRSATPDVNVEFYCSKFQKKHAPYFLIIYITNNGNIAVNKFKLRFHFPYLGSALDWSNNVRFDDAVSIENKNDGTEFTYLSQNTLFPEDKHRVQFLDFTFELNSPIISALETNDAKIQWHLYADNMIPKHGEQSMLELFKTKFIKI